MNQTQKTFSVYQQLAQAADVVVFQRKGALKNVLGSIHVHVSIESLLQVLKYGAY